MLETAGRIEFVREGNVAHIRLDRPEKLNALTDAMNAELAEAWRCIEEDDAITCALLSGIGERAFCVGADTGGGYSDAYGLAFGGGLTGVGGPMATLRKPLVAAVHGYCLGGGFELAMCADVIIARDDTQFGLPETSAGIIGHCGVVHRAVRKLPHAIAMGMILGGERLSAQDAARHGLVNIVATKEDIHGEVARWIAQITACSPGANMAAKAAAIRGLCGSLPEAVATRYPEIDAFVARRVMSDDRGRLG